MSELTQDERTVLMIAAEGESMMAIARWEAPTESLVAKGLMQRADKFNNFITPAGREALKGIEQADDANFREIAGKMINVHNCRVQARMSAEQAAHHLSLAARASASATGDTLEAAARAWSKVVLDAALELLK